MDPFYKRYLRTTNLVERLSANLSELLKRRYAVTLEFYLGAPNPLIPLPGYQKFRLSCKKLCRELLHLSVCFPNLRHEIHSSTLLLDLLCFALN